MGYEFPHHDASVVLILIVRGVRLLTPARRTQDHFSRTLCVCEVAGEAGLGSATTKKTNSTNSKSIFDNAAGLTHTKKE